MAESLDSILSDNHPQHQSFCSFLQSNYDPSLQVYFVIQEYKKQNDKKLRQAKANEIYKKYLSKAHLIYL